MKSEFKFGGKKIVLITDEPEPAKRVVRAKHKPTPEESERFRAFLAQRISEFPSREEFIKKVGCDKCMLSRWERGKRYPSAYYRHMISTVLP
jgi:transcriptional regulator with XRE-family HTH domain